jgi:hypothetical protein
LQFIDDDDQMKTAIGAIGLTKFTLKAMTFGA